MLILHHLCVLQVTDFAWSHDGRMALICYRDGFVLVGSVAGQRFWSSMLNLDNTSITCGIWSPDDQEVSIVKKNDDLKKARKHPLCTDDYTFDYTYR